MGVHARVRLAGFLTLVGESARPCFVVLSRRVLPIYVALSSQQTCVSRTNTIFFKSSTFLSPVRGGAANSCGVQYLLYTCTTVSSASGSALLVAMLNRRPRFDFVARSMNTTYWGATSLTQCGKHLPYKCGVLGTIIIYSGVLALMQHPFD